MNNTHKHTRLIVITALFTAITAVCTAFLSFRVLTNEGYIHFGDAIIMLSAALLPTPYAVFVGAIGGGVADLLAGAPLWAPFTLVIKAVVALCYSSKGEKLFTIRNAVGFFPMTVITIGGYYLAEALLYGNWQTPVFAIYGNVIQSVGSVIIFSVFALALDKVNFKNKTLKLIGVRWKEK